MRKTTINYFTFSIPESNKNDFDNCIHMTEDIQHQINSLVNKLSSYITTLSTEYEDIDLRSIAFNIDKHSPNEDEKDTVIKITINDCLERSKQTEYIENIEENKAPTHIENSRNNSEESENKYKKVDTENQNITVKGEVHQEEIEAAKRGDTFDYNKNYIQNSDKLDFIEDINNVSNNHQGEVKDVIKEMNDGEIVLKERKNKTNFKDINSEEKRYLGGTVNENKVNYKSDDMFVDDDNDNDFDKRSNKTDKTKQLVDSSKDDAFSADSELNYDNTSKNENSEFDSVEHKNNDSLENTKEVYLIDYKEFKKSNIDDDDNKTNICEEVLLLSDEEKIIFNEIEKVRGEKPFMVYQRFFHNFTQYWFF
ncbi:uncharacterized protein DDB_G0292186-like [Melitaea cinxia]|uniref:uncharacterized protein DDB_G0292186-like n=1 Tax=Melitaea cinxia TaxID=113334 RepID=UPI001E26FDB7|nr:uncharacterized protein DDB_G0292186-like [Melitaea cinxia]